jgi:hypothetical protein
VNLKLNWPNVIAALSAAAGIAGTIITPIWGDKLAASVQAALMAVSGLLIAITGYHATSVVSTRVKAQEAHAMAARFAAEAAPPPAPTPAPKNGGNKGVAK